MNHTVGLIAGLALLSSTAAIALQGASEPVKSAPEYFVTDEGTSAHLWLREGIKLRAVGHGECKDCPAAAAHEHTEGDGHDKDSEHGHEHK